MTHNERLEGLDRYDLFNLIELAKKKKQALDEAEKSLYYVVSDEFMNIGFFKQDNLEGALKCLVEEARKGSVKDRGEYLQIQLQRWYDDEVADLVKENE